MADIVIEALILDLLEWLASGEWAYEEVIDLWRTSCPRLRLRITGFSARSTRVFPGACDVERDSARQRTSPMHGLGVQVRLWSRGRQ
jgi:hypothetical protein